MEYLLIYIEFSGVSIPDTSIYQFKLQFKKDLHLYNLCL